MQMRRFITIPLLAICFFQFCTKPENPSPTPLAAGNWEIETAVIEEYFDNTLYFSYTRTIDSSRLELYSDNVYRSIDPDFCIYFFTLEGFDKATNVVEGGMWAPENNYSIIRLDKNVPEFSGRNPTVLNVDKLTSDEFNFTYNLDLWHFGEDTNKIETGTRNFIIPEAEKDGRGRLFTDTSGAEGYKIGYTTGYEIGSFQTNPNKYVSTRYVYYNVLLANWFNYFDSNPEYSDFANFNLQFRKGYVDGLNIGRQAGTTAPSLRKPHKTYKFIYKTRKAGDL